VLLLGFIGMLTVIIFILNLELFQLKKKFVRMVVYTEEKARLHRTVASGAEL
jgi:hypothetical protein